MMDTICSLVESVYWHRFLIVLGLLLLTIIVSISLKGTKKRVATKVLIAVVSLIVVMVVQVEWNTFNTKPMITEVV